MVKVITYGTYDLLHFGHIRLLERAKALGDYLIVGVTADDFDITRGKINVQQSLMERVEAVRAIGIADEIIVEEYEGQKIDDIQKYGIDIFTVGSDWTGTFDYLNEYCKVVYLDRTQGVSSSELRSQNREIVIGVVGESVVVRKFITESNYVNGVRISGIYTKNNEILTECLNDISLFEAYEVLVNHSDALYIASHPTYHYEQIKYALERGKHVIYESPITLKVDQAKELIVLAEKKNCVLYAGIKTAYATAYARMILFAKTGKIGDIVSVDSVCTSLREVDYTDEDTMKQVWNSMATWAPIALLPVFQLLGTAYRRKHIYSRVAKEVCGYDEFSKVEFVFPHAVASIKVGKGAKSEGALVVSGTEGYIYVPAPWWKTEYFEIRYEDVTKNKRFFYQLEGEGIRYELASFVKSITKHTINYISRDQSLAITKIMEDFFSKKDFTEI